MWWDFCLLDRNNWNTSTREIREKIESSKYSMPMTRLKQLAANGESNWLKLPNYELVCPMSRFVGCMGCLILICVAVSLRFGTTQKSKSKYINLFQLRDISDRTLITHVTCWHVNTLTCGALVLNRFESLLIEWFNQMNTQITMK